MKRSKSSKKLNVVILLCTLASAILTGLGVKYIHGIVSSVQKENVLHMPLFMAAVFAGFLIITGLVVFLISNMTLTYRADVITGRNSKGRFFLYMVLGIVIIGLFLFGMEYLYEQNFQNLGKKNASGTYVFLIDDSGTMENNDPNNMRYKVVKSLLSGKPAKTQFAMYTFSDETKLRIPMRTVGDGFPSFPEPDYFMTNMQDGLIEVIDDYEKGIWTESGETMVILITDGFPSDFSSFAEIRPVLDRYVKQGIKLNIVGVVGADNTLMNEMAVYTGGSFIDINDAALMDEAVRNVAGTTGRTRDLMTVRDAVEMDWLYAVIRVLTFVIAGTLIAVVAALCYGNNTAFSFIIWANAIKAVLAGILMEVAFLISPTGSILPLISWVLLGTILAQMGTTEEKELSNTVDIDFFDEGPRRSSGYR